MYKTLCVAALLLGLLALTGRSSSAAPAPFSSPLIVAKGKLVNQTAPIPSTTLFMPNQTGLYRLSVYGTISQVDPNSSSGWIVTPSWTDDYGSESSGSLLTGYGNHPGQFQSNGDNSSLGGITVPFEAKAGTPITYVVEQSPSPDNSAYSLYYTLERLE